MILTEPVAGVCEPSQHEPPPGLVVLLEWGQRPDPPAASQLVPGLAVVVCTSSRPPSVNRFLHSLRGQSRPAQLLIIDASREGFTEAVVRRGLLARRAADHVVYARVAADRRGLTRQRNTALSLVWTDLVAFFDDDVVLRTG